MNKVINKKAISIIIILTTMIILFVVANTFINNNLIKQTISKTFKQEEEKLIFDGISCRALDNTGEKIKAFVTITRENGIEKIEYITGNEEEIVLNCNNKPKVTIDIEILVDEEQQFKVTSNGEEKVETVRLNSDYIEDYIKITKLDNDNQYDQVDIEFNPVQASLNYYKINKGPWVAYSSTLSLDISNVILEKLENDEYDTTIYAMCVDNSGNTLISSKIIELTKKYPDFNLFYNMDISGKTDLGEYGLWVTSWSGTDSDWRWFQVRAMGGGHWKNSGSFNVVITMNWNNPEITFDNITTTFALYAEGSWSKSRGAIIVNYVDGTSTSSGTGTYDRRGTVYWNTAIQPDESKQIKNIQFVCSGSDGSGDGSSSRVQEVYFNGLKKVNN